MKLSVVIPAYNEEGIIDKTILSLTDALQLNDIDYEVVVVNDYSSDATADVIKKWLQGDPRIHIVDNKYKKGYGSACRTGIESSQGDSIVFFMADLSDSPSDLVKFYVAMNTNGCDMVFGDRWSGSNRVTGYPFIKHIVNRMANYLVSALFGLHYYDITNGFKLYKKHVVDSLQPFKATQFNFALELPLRAINAGYSFTVVENSWTNNKPGKSNLKLYDMSGKYFGTLIDCLKQKYFK